MKFLFCADLHLDSKMNSVLPAKIGASRRRELLLSFKNLFTSAEKHGAEAIIIGGDLFDSNTVSAKTLSYVLDTVKENSNLDVYLLGGNHDPEIIAKMSENNLPNLYVFGEDWTVFEREGVILTGRSRLSENMYNSIPSLAKDSFNIVVLHGQEIYANTEIPDGIIVPNFKNKNIDVLAMGHVHTHKICALDGRGALCYSGCPEGRGFDECGDMGFIIIDSEKKGEKALTFVKSAARIFNDVSLKLDVFDLTLKDFENKLLDAVKNIPENDFVKVTLCGAFSSSAQKDIGYMQSLLDERFYYAKIKDQSELYIDESEYIGDISLKGEFIRTVKAIDGDESFLRDVAECGIKALRGDEIF